MKPTEVPSRRTEGNVVGVVLESSDAEGFFDQLDDSIHRRQGGGTGTFLPVPAIRDVTLLLRLAEVGCGAGLPRVATVTGYPQRRLAGPCERLVALTLDLEALPHRHQPLNRSRHGRQPSEKTPRRSATSCKCWPSC